jgi:hypothetical protein
VSGTRERALRRLGVPESPTATKALSQAMSKALASRSEWLPRAHGPGRIIESLPDHVRSALDDLRSGDITDLRDDLVRKVLRR